MVGGMEGRKFGMEGKEVWRGGREGRREGGREGGNLYDIMSQRKYGEKMVDYTSTSNETCPAAPSIMRFST